MRCEASAPSSRGLPMLAPRAGLAHTSGRGGSILDRREKQALISRLERDAEQICGRFRLRYRVLEPERANVKRRYGVCFSDGTIRIRLAHATTRRPLKYSSLVNTLCHELAHLRHFNHGPAFQTFYAQILEWARKEGIYRPGPEQPWAPKASPRIEVSKGLQKERPTSQSAKVPEPSPVRVQLELFP